MKYQWILASLFVSSIGLAQEGPNGAVSPQSHDASVAKPGEATEAAMVAVDPAMISAAAWKDNLKFCTQQGFATVVGCQCAVNNFVLQMARSPKASEMASWSSKDLASQNDYSTEVSEVRRAPRQVAYSKLSSLNYLKKYAYSEEKNKTDAVRLSQGVLAKVTQLQELCGSASDAGPTKNAGSCSCAVVNKFGELLSGGSQIDGKSLRELAEQLKDIKMEARVTRPRQLETSFSLSELLTGSANFPR